jgi:hypothetical protein
MGQFGIRTKIWQFYGLFDRVSRHFHLITGQSNPSDRIGMRRRDAPKSDEHTRVPERKGVIRIAPGGTGEDMALPFFDIANLGISHRKKVEEQPHQ